MELCRLLKWCYIVICFTVITHSNSKPFSINEYLAAKGVNTTRPKQPKNTGNLITLGASNRNLQVEKPKTKKSKLFQDLILKGRHIIPRYRTSYQLAKPLKSRTLRNKYKRPYKHKNQSVKRETNSNKYGRKYTPLLKKIGMLFDNLLNSDRSDSIELENRKEYNRVVKYSTADNNIVCKCSSTPRKSQSNQFNKNQKAVALTKNPTFEITSFHQDTTITEATTQATNSAAISNINGIRPDPRLPLLSTRNSTSIWRNNPGIIQRNHTPRHRNFEGNITRNYRHDEHNTTGQGFQTDAGRNEEIPYYIARNSSSSSRPRLDVGLGRHGNTPQKELQFIKGKSQEGSESGNDSREIRGDLTNLEITTENEMGRSEAENIATIPEYNSRVERSSRGPLSKDQELHYKKPIQSNKINASSDNYDRIFYPSYQGVIDRNGSSTTKIQGTLSENPTLLNIVPSAMKHFDWNNTNKNVVTIIDGYSIARGKNGENTITQKSIHIKS